MTKTPWNFSKMNYDGSCVDCTWPSPDKLFTIKYSDVKEIVTNYPLTARSVLMHQNEEILLHIDAGGPPVWSADSKFFALPIWLYNEHGYVQRIGIGCIEEMNFKISTEYFKVMQLLSIDGDTVKLIESPNLKAKERILKINELDFYETVHLKETV
ncbi:MAG: hypothetical protein P1P88_03670 [Bacteroidales bacterium]|nr:hypothetical protein [Bacteroidales bacterium]